MYLIASTRCGISAKQLERELGVTYKTAWRMFNLIRNELMADDRDVRSPATWKSMRRGTAGRCASPTVARLPSAGRKRCALDAKKRASSWVSWSAADASSHYTVGAGTADTLRRYVAARRARSSTPTTTRLQRRRAVYTHHRINHSGRVYVEATSTPRPSRGSSRCSRTASGASTTPSRQVASGLPERVRVALQPSRQRTLDVPRPARRSREQDRLTLVNPV